MALGDTDEEMRELVDFYKKREKERAGADIFRWLYGVKETYRRDYMPFPPGAFVKDIEIEPTKKQLKQVMSEHPCHECGKVIVTHREEFYAIYRQRVLGHAMGVLVFHVECFEKVAGEDYKI